MGLHDQLVTCERPTYLTGASCCEGVASRELASSIADVSVVCRNGGTHWCQLSPAERQVWRGPARANDRQILTGRPSMEQTSFPANGSR